MFWINASSTVILQKIFNNAKELKKLQTDLAYIYANFSFLSITKFENLFKKKDKLNKINESKTDAIKQELSSCQ
jgi:hypothetical protein